MLLAAVIHGATNAWHGYINIYRGNFANILVYTALMLIVSIVIVLLAGPAKLSRTNKKNVLEPELVSPGETVSPVGI